MQETEWFMQVGAFIGYIWGLIVALFAPKIINVIRNTLYNKKNKKAQRQGKQNKNESHN